MTMVRTVEACYGILAVTRYSDFCIALWYTGRLDPLSFLIPVSFQSYGRKG